MNRRIGFIVSVCGMAFVLVPFVQVLEQADFVACTVGFALVLVGIFFAIESVARHRT